MKLVINFFNLFELENILKNNGAYNYEKGTYSDFELITIDPDLHQYLLIIK